MECCAEEVQKVETCSLASPFPKALPMALSTTMKDRRT